MCIKQASPTVPFELKTAVRLYLELLEAGVFESTDRPLIAGLYTGPNVLEVQFIDSKIDNPANSAGPVTFPPMGLVEDADANDTAGCLQVEIVKANRSDEIVQVDAEENRAGTIPVGDDILRHAVPVPWAVTHRKELSHDGIVEAIDISGGYVAGK